MSRKPDLDFACTVHHHHFAEDFQRAEERIESLKAHYSFFEGIYKICETKGLETLQRLYFFRFHLQLHPNVGVALVLPHPFKQIMFVPYNVGSFIKGNGSPATMDDRRASLASPLIYFEGFLGLEEFQGDDGLGGVAVGDRKRGWGRGVILEGGLDPARGTGFAVFYARSIFKHLAYYLALRVGTEFCRRSAF